jgi:maleylpyruvate isomerase
MDRSDVTADLVDRETRRLLGTVERLTDGDVSAPSLCEGWCRGHVLSHLARNAEGIARASRAATSATGETMYAGPAERDADIEAGAHRRADELAADVRDTARALAPELARVHPLELHGVRVERTPGGPTFWAANLPFMRLREVVVHHLDLDAGFGFDDLDQPHLTEIAQLFLRDAVARLAAADDPLDLTLRTDTGEEHVVGDGTTRVTGTLGALLRWLLRQDATGVSSDTPLPQLPPVG